MFDPVKLFEDIALSNSLTFIYGSKAHLNWEVTQKYLKNGSIFLAMFPFSESALIHNGAVSGWSVSTVLWVGVKYDPSLTTYSNLDETWKQKYDRRLKTLSAKVQTILSDLCVSSVELTSARRFREINKFDENTDVVGCEVTFMYDINDDNSALSITGITADNTIVTADNVYITVDSL